MNVNKYIMRRILTILSFCVVSTGFGQVFDGEGDTKISLGASFQSKGVGAFGAFDRGINDYLSYGVSFGAVLKSDYPTEIVTTDEFGFETSEEILESDSFTEKLDFNARLNLHFNHLLDLGYNFDFFVGPNIGRNLGGQIGTRYLVTENVGLFAEAYIPISTNIINFEDSEVNYYKFYEQPVFNIGIVINWNSIF